MSPVSFTSLLIHTVAIYNPTVASQDRRLNDVMEDGEAAESAARVELLKADEVDNGKSDVRVATYRVFLPRDTDIRSTSKVEWEGRMHRVLGEPDFLDGRHGPHHIEVVIELTEGV